MGITAKKNYRYSCPWCGQVYQHDEAYIHSIAQCQKVERVTAQKGRKVKA